MIFSIIESKCGGNIKEIIEKLNGAFEELGIEKIENMELLLNLTREDIEKKTNLSYQVTPILEQLLKLSRIYVYLSDDEENELLMMNQTDFFSKIHYITRLSEKLLDEFRIQDVIHPVLASDFEFGDVIDSQEDCAFALNEIYEILAKRKEERDEWEEETRMDSISSQISVYSDRVSGYYQVVFYRQVVPKLRDDMFSENYQHALEVLSDYIDLKTKLLAGLDEDNSLYLTDVAINLHRSLDDWIVEDIQNRIEIEEDEFDTEELTDEEYFNLLVLMFENRYQRQKSCCFYYHEELCEVETYKEKCKKM